MEKPDLICPRLGGMSELSARLRDSAVLQLWNLSFLLTLFVTWSVTRPGPSCHRSIWHPNNSYDQSRYYGLV